MHEIDEPEVLRGVARVAAEVLGVGEGRVGAVARVKGGLTNETWRVDVGEETLVVRISRADDEALQIDRESERQVLEAAWRAGIGPEVLLCAPKRRLLVTRLIAGRTWSEEDAVAPENVARLGRLFAKLHATPVPPGAQRVDVALSLEGYWRSLDGARTTPEAAAMLGVARTLAADGDARLCHNDVHRLNLIDAGALRLLDWEYAGQGSPYFDLASVCSYHAFDRARRERLLHAYLGRADAGAAERLTDACALFDYVRRLWLQVRQGT